MKKKFLLIISVLIVSIVCAAYLWPKIFLFAQPLLFQNELMKRAEEDYPFLANETIEYLIKLRGIRIGRATLIYKGKTKLEGKDVHLVLFRTKTLNFKDKETMYADIDNFLPLRIERDINNNWGKKTRIIEEYNQRNNSVTITRINRRGEKSRTIQKDAHIQNLILLTFLCRKSGDFKIGKEFFITLPLLEFMMRFTEEEKVKVPRGLYRAYLAESFPRGYKIWFEDSSKFIPIKISGRLFLGPVSLEMVGYAEGGK